MIQPRQLRSSHVFDIQSAASEQESFCCRGCRRSDRCTPALAQHSGHGTPSGTALPEAAPSSDPFARLQGGVPHHLTTEQEAQRIVDSPAPKGPPGRWTRSAALPIPRSEMAWATAAAAACTSSAATAKARSTAPTTTSTTRRPTAGFDAAPLPRGANHVAVAADAGRVYASAASSSRTAIRTRSLRLRDRGRPLDADRAVAAAARRGGGRRARRQDPSDRRRVRAQQPSAPASAGTRSTTRRPTRGRSRKALPGARDHVGCVAHSGVIHIIGGRFNTFEYNTDLHHVYLPGARHLGGARAAADARVPAMASSSTAAASSRWAAKAACSDDGRSRRRTSSARWRATIPRRHLAEPRADADAAPRGGRRRHRRLRSTLRAAAR